MNDHALARCSRFVSDDRTSRRFNRIPHSRDLSEQARSNCGLKIVIAGCLIVVGMHRYCDLIDQAFDKASSQNGRIDLASVASFLNWNAVNCCQRCVKVYRDLTTPLFLVRLQFDGGKQLRGNSGWGQCCQQKLAMLPKSRCASFLRHIVRQSPRLARLPYPKAVSPKNRPNRAYRLEPTGDFPATRRPEFWRVINGQDGPGSINSKKKDKRRAEYQSERYKTANNHFHGCCFNLNGCRSYLGTTI